MVFQSFNLFANKTILENVTLALIKVRHMDKKEAEQLAMDLLARVGVDSQASKMPPSSPAASSSVWPSPARSPCAPRSCCSTSPPPHSTRKWSTKCST